MFATQSNDKKTNQLKHNIQSNSETRYANYFTR